jgi:hypothetical protein
MAKMAETGHTGTHAPQSNAFHRIDVQFIYVVKPRPAVVVDRYSSLGGCNLPDTRTHTRCP